MPRPIFSNETVRLVRELPELKLDVGTVGVVRSAWFYPTVAYEVEFPGRGPARANRLLLLDGEISPTSDQVAEMAQCFAAALTG